MNINSDVISILQQKYMSIDEMANHYNISTFDVYKTLIDVYDMAAAIDLKLINNKENFSLVNSSKKKLYLSHVYKLQFEFLRLNTMTIHKNSLIDWISTSKKVSSLRFSVNNSISIIEEIGVVVTGKSNKYRIHSL
jgi:antitoxin component HigA of HigAB toxin-antitoxin module